jgi:hypothetical protein
MRATGSFRDHSSVTNGLAKVFREDRLGALWIGFNTGLARYRNGRFEFFAVADGLPAGDINDLYVDRSSRLWIASTDGGLGRIDDPGAPHPHIVTISTAQGLSGNAVSIRSPQSLGRNCTLPSFALFPRFRSKGNVGGLQELTALDVGFVSLSEALDLTTPSGRALAGMLAVFAEFERDILRDRVKAGIDQARKDGKPHGRPVTAGKLVPEMKQLRKGGVSKRAIAKQLGVSRTSVIRLLRSRKRS